MTPIGRFLLVELAQDLRDQKQTLGGVYALLRVIPGVVAVTDMAAISADTLTDILLPPEQGWRSIPRKRGRHAR